MSKYLFLVPVALFALAALACGDEDEKMTSGEAMQVYGAVNGAAGSVQSEVTTGAQQAKADQIGSFEYTVNGNDVTFDGSVNGPNGGSAHATGTIVVSDNAGDVNLDFDMSFQGWTNGGLVIEGSLSISIIVAGKITELDYTGDVEVTGDVEGSVEFDIHVKVDGNSGSVEYEGTVGGTELGGGVNYNDYL
jgi:hypothetical protein